jgi:hypothetical protein
MSLSIGIASTNRPTSETYKYRLATKPVGACIRERQQHHYDQLADDDQGQGRVVAEPDLGLQEGV